MSAETEDFIDRHGDGLASAMEIVYKMNSVLIVNWVDKEFLERLQYSLQKHGYLVTEDYEGVGTKTIVCVKSPKTNEPGAVPVGLGHASSSIVAGGSGSPSAVAGGKAM